MGSLDASKLKVGDIMSRVSYMKVVSIDGDSVVVRNEKGFQWSISKGVLEAEARSSSQFSKTEKVTRTELARILEQDVRDSAFCVTFNKLPDASDQEAVLAGADLSTPAKRKRVAKELAVGKERVLHGHIEARVRVALNFCKSSQNSRGGVAALNFCKSSQNSRGAYHHRCTQFSAPLYATGHA